VALGVEVGLDDVADEIAPRFRYRRFACCHSFNPAIDSRLQAR
jgi:hypothetical protein